MLTTFVDGNEFSINVIMNDCVKFTSIAKEWHNIFHNWDILFVLKPTIVTIQSVVYCIWYDFIGTFERETMLQIVPSHI